MNAHRLVVAGGGTGGHIFAGVAIAQELLKTAPGSEVLFVGSEYGLETRLVPKAGLKLESLRVGRLVGQSRLAQLKTLVQIPLAVLRSIAILRRFHADMVVGVGGFASGPCVLAARLLGIRTGVLEQNSIAGFTNKVLAKLAHQVFTAFPEPPPGFPVGKCIYTGNPTRGSLREKRSTGDGPFTIFAFGGSQGATGINKLLTGAVKILRSQGEGIAVIHQTGEKDYDWVMKEYAGISGVEVHRFIDDMQACYDRASIVLCRAGSSTISELGATKTPAVFVPFPAAAGNHQEINARAVERAGGARVILQQSASAEDLAKVLVEIKNNPAELAEMRECIGQFHRPDAAHKILSVMGKDGLDPHR